MLGIQNSTKKLTKTCYHPVFIRIWSESGLIGNNVIEVKGIKYRIMSFMKYLNVFQTLTIIAHLHLNKFMICYNQAIVMLMSTFSTIFIRKRMQKYQKFKEWISKLIVLGITFSAVEHTYIYTHKRNTFSSYDKHTYIYTC